MSVLYDARRDTECGCEITSGTVVRCRQGVVSTEAPALAAPRTHTDTPAGLLRLSTELTPPGAAHAHSAGHDFTKRQGRIDAPGRPSTKLFTLQFYSFVKLHKWGRFFFKFTIARSFADYVCEFRAFNFFFLIFSISALVKTEGESGANSAALAKPRTPRRGRTPAFRESPSVRKISNGTTNIPIGSNGGKLIEKLSSAAMAFGFGEHSCSARFKTNSLSSLGKNESIYIYMIFFNFVKISGMIFLGFHLTQYREAT